MRRNNRSQLVAAALLAACAAGGAAPAVLHAAPTGAEVYEANCAACHLPDGAGVPGLAPPLKSDLWKRLGARSTAYIAGVLVHGMVGVPLDGQRYGAAMPPWGHLSDEEIAAVGNFVLGTFNGIKGKVKPAEVREARKAPADPGLLKLLRDGGAS